MEPSEEDEVQLPWDEPQQDLHVELAFLWANTLSGQRRLDMKAVWGISLGSGSFRGKRYKTTIGMIATQNNIKKSALGSSSVHGVPEVGWT